MHIGKIADVFIPRHALSWWIYFDFFRVRYVYTPENYHGIWKWTPWKKEMPNLKTHHFQVRAVSFRVQVVYNNIISRCTDWACGFSPFLWQKKNGSKQAKGIRDEAIYVFICLYIVRIYLPILFLWRIFILSCVKHFPDFHPDKSMQGLKFGETSKKKHIHVGKLVNLNEQKVKV